MNKKHSRRSSRQTDETMPPENPGRGARPRLDETLSSEAVSARRIGWTIAALLVAGIVLIVGTSLAQRARQRAASGGVSPSSASVAAPSDAPSNGPAAQLVAQSRPAVDPLPPGNPLNGERAYRYLQDICAIGRRLSGSPGMKQQQELLKKHFESLGGKVMLQEFQAKNPLGGQVAMANMIVTWHPEKNERILLCAHYDTRPLPDQDPDPVNRRQGVFIGANDGASGTAVLMELAHLMPRLESRYGVDFVLFDGEELVYDDDRDPYFLGSEHFAREYVRQPPTHKYRWGVLMDMVGDADLQIYQEQNSVSWPDTRPLVAQIWGLARQLGVREFIARAKYDVRDDHLALRNIAKIPTCDIIDFDYDPWHTVADTPQRCAPSSLAKVGWVIYEWLKRAE